MSKPSKPNESDARVDAVHKWLEQTRSMAERLGWPAPWTPVWFEYLSREVAENYRLVEMVLESSDWALRMMARTRLDQAVERGDETLTRYQVRGDRTVEAVRLSEENYDSVLELLGADGEVVSYGREIGVTVGAWNVVVSRGMWLVRESDNGDWDVFTAEDFHERYEAAP